MLSVIDDKTERTETRMQAATWLADRGFGKAPATLESGADKSERIVIESPFGHKHYSVWCIEPAA